jgi:hypothetical protein
MNFDHFTQEIGKLPFQGTAHHAWLIYGLIRQHRPKVVIETGTYAGYVTGHIALALWHNGDDGQVYSIDDYSYGEFDIDRVNQNLNNVFGGKPSNVVLLKGDSVDILRQWQSSRYPIDFAVLDGSRVLPRFAEEVMRVVQGGATCWTLHDTHHDLNARWYADQFRAHMTDWDCIDFHMDGGLLVAEKKQPGLPKDLTGWRPAECASFLLPNGFRVEAVDSYEEKDYIKSLDLNMGLM